MARAPPPSIPSPFMGERSVNFRDPRPANAACANTNAAPTAAANPGCTRRRCCIVPYLKPSSRQASRTFAVLRSTFRKARFWRTWLRVRGRGMLISSCASPAPPSTAPPMRSIAEAVRRDGVDPDGGAARLERAEPVRRGQAIHSPDPLEIGSRSNPNRTGFSFAASVTKVGLLGVWGRVMVRLWAANTDLDWFDYLAAQPDIDEVNFWQPSGHANFGAIAEGELFLFKLKSPRNVIGGFGVMSQSTNMPLSLAWEAFGTKNGARTLPEMRARVLQYRTEARDVPDPVIGCRVVVQPVFLPESLWIPQPESWVRSIVVGKTYDTSTDEGRRLWEQVMAAAEAAPAAVQRSSVAEQQSIYIASGPKYGEPHLIRPRLGQGAFRLAVTDAYNRECAVTGVRVLPALEAAHIQSYSTGGEHEISNGLLLRRDIHSVFDAGYLTFDEDLCVVVSDRVRTEFNNGNEYRRLQGEKLRLPPNPKFDPIPHAWSGTARNGSLHD